jgi:hypothetical protein
MNRIVNWIIALLVCCIVASVAIDRLGEAEAVCFERRTRDIMKQAEDEAFASVGPPEYELAENLKKLAAVISQLDGPAFEELRPKFVKSLSSWRLTTSTIHKPGFCSIKATRPGLSIHAWAHKGVAELKVTTD